MQYIDADGSKKEISDTVEKQFYEQNKKWIPVERTMIVVVIVGVLYGFYSIYQSLPR